LQSNVGVFPCCHEDVKRFDTLYNSKPSGCSFKNHEVDAQKLTDQDRENL